MKWNAGRMERSSRSVRTHSESNTESGKTDCKQFPTAAVHKRQKETIRTKPEAAAVDSSKYGQV